MTFENDVLERDADGDGDAVAPSRGRYRNQARLALIVFCVVEVGAALWWLHIGRHSWFFFDEWVFVTQPSLSPRHLLAPYNSHWVTLPMLSYRLLWQLFGLNTYTPYVAVTIGLQAANAALLRVFMRRVGVGPWIATFAASLFLLFGTGQENVLWAFQVTFTASLMFGLVQLLLVDRDGPFGWRDWLALGSGLAALMCSDVGVAMVVGVGVAVLIRRGWRAALMNTAPLAVIFGLWWVICQSWAQYRLGEGAVHPGEMAPFIVTGIGATFGALGQVTGTGWILGAMFVVGLLLAWVQTPPADRARRFGIIAGLLVATLVFLVITAVGRAHDGVDRARAGRYLHIQAALLLPALALAADATIRRWRVAGPVVVALLLVGIPGNLSTGSAKARRTASVAIINKQVLAIPRSPLAHAAPRSLVPFPQFPLDHMTVGWLLDALQSGRLPKTPVIPEASTIIGLKLSLVTTNGPPGSPCRSLVEPVIVKLATREALGTRGFGVTITDLAPANGVQAAAEFNAGDHRLVALRPLTLRVASTHATAPAELCGIP
jgi:hypothetical protein